jgi:hypothetical protein
VRAVAVESLTKRDAKREDQGERCEGEHDA